MAQVDVDKVKEVVAGMFDDSKTSNYNTHIVAALRKIDLLVNNFDDKKDCPSCNGFGFVNADQNYNVMVCPKCKGSGWVFTRHSGLEEQTIDRHKQEESPIQSSDLKVGDRVIFFTDHEMIVGTIEYIKDDWCFIKHVNGQYYSVYKTDITYRIRLEQKEKQKVECTEPSAKKGQEENTDGFNLDDYIAWVENENYKGRTGEVEVHQITDEGKRLVYRKEFNNDPTRLA